MRVGYVSTNYSLGCKADKTIKLSSLSEERVLKVSSSNLLCLKNILEWNLKHEILFFRISSNTIPLASHPKFHVNWKDKLSHILGDIGDFIKENSIRISMHPGQYVVLNSVREEVVRSSIMELKYHADLLDSMGIEGKIQIHVGSYMNGKEESLNRFIENFRKLPSNISKRLVIENDDKVFSVKDCLWISERTGIPVIFDNLHHSILNNGESLNDALSLVRRTWKDRPMIDYSEQEPGEKPGVHATTINEENFRRFVNEVDEVDIMLEVKDKEISALKAVKVLKELNKLD